MSVADKGAGPYGIAAGPDGALWLTFVHSGRIARLTLDGELSEFPWSRPSAALRSSPRARRSTVVHPVPGPPDRPHHRRR
ncbi:virginiamycin B lyase family protein [Streptomyces sp. MAR4 CNY-716]